VALVLLRLCDRADHEGKCWPGHQRTASDLNIAQSTARTAIQALAKAGLLAVHSREIEGRSASNLYFLAVDNFPESEENRVPKSGTRVPNKTDGRVPKSGTESVSKENLPQKREGARGARPVGASPHTPRAGRGDSLIFHPETRVHYKKDDPRDQAAILQILRYEKKEIDLAVAQAEKTDDLGRAFPSKTLRILRVRAQERPQGAVPGWLKRRRDQAAAMAVCPVSSGDAAANVIEGEVKWST
jgi:hypothetical protein